MNADEYHHQQELHQQWLEQEWLGQQQLRQQELRQQWLKKKELARVAQDELNKIIQEIKNNDYNDSRQTSKATSSK